MRGRLSCYLEAIGVLIWALWLRCSGHRCGLKAGGEIPCSHLQKLQSLHLTCGYPRARRKMKKGLSTQAKWASSSSDGSSLGDCSHFSQTSRHTQGVLQTQQRSASRQWRKSQALQEDDTLEPHFPESGGWQAFKEVSAENTPLKDMLSKNKQTKKSHGQIRMNCI